MFELAGYEEHMRDSMGKGDPRRCPRHPHIKTSSDDGMFDAPCTECEAEMSEADDMWEYDTTNPHRLYCSLRVPYYPPDGSGAMCDNDDNIPF